MEFFERFLYKKEGFWQWTLFVLLAPLGWLNCLISLLTIRSREQKEFGIAVIGIGNLVVGGTGKTPLTAYLASQYANSAVVLRGYKRKSRGLIVVANGGKILVDVERSGDEAMLYAKLLPNSTIIVSESRSDGINKAKELGATVVFLDDAFRHQYIKKFDILIRPATEPESDLCLPASAYRQSKKLYNRSDLTIKEGVDYTRGVTLQNPTEQMVLVTSIAKPDRLDPFLPSDLIAKYHFADHHHFTKEQLDLIVNKHNATSLLVTTKDAVKLERFGYALSILQLDLIVSDHISQAVKEYAQSYSG